MLITPRISEKSYGLAAKNVYVFDVPLDANKAEVESALKEQFPDIKVGDVRLMIVKGKTKAVNRGKRSRPGQTTRKSIKKAYVTVTEGKIEVSGFEQADYQPVEQEETKRTETKIKAGAETKQAGLLGRRRTGSRGDK